MRKLIPPLFKGGTRSFEQPFIYNKTKISQTALIIVGGSGLQCRLRFEPLMLNHLWIPAFAGMTKALHRNTLLLLVILR